MCLGGQRGEPAYGGSLKGAADGGGARVEVEVFPAQAEEFAFAESGVEGELEQRVQPVVLGGGEELAGLVSCAPDLNPVEGIWLLLRRGWLSDVAFSTPEHLIQTVRHGLRHIPYRSHFIDGCLTETDLTLRPA